MKQTINLSRLTEINNIRDIWPNEQYDFTPWLATPANLEMLADELGVEIINPVTESSIGKYTVDIVAETADGKTLIIENQLEDSDHKHLGQLLTYASGKNADYIVWIVKKANAEHRSAIEWLNENTNDKLHFFLIELRVFKIGNSDLAPKFEVLSKPNEWSKILNSNNNQANKEYVSNNLDFWTRFIDYSQSFKHRTPSKGHWFTISLGSSDAQINLIFAKQKAPKGACIELNFKTDELYDSFKEQLPDIESQYNFKFTLNKRTKGGLAFVSTKYSIKDKDNWNDIYDYYIQNLDKIKEIYTKYVGK
ncbi:MAG: DUF4268 domain-containing protein [Patescibacteria group bacterium]